jgi:hypothetical protein
MAKPIAPQLRSGPFGPGKPNAATQKIRDDRAIAQAKGERYIRAADSRPVTPANTKSASARGTAPPGQVNKATQAVRDARAVSKAAGERYVRKAGGEQSVNAQTQQKRLERAVTRAMSRQAPVVVEPPDIQRGATDWQKASADWWAAKPTGGIDPAFDINNADAKYQADANLKYRDYEGGTISAADIAKNLRKQIVKAMKAGKTQVVLPDGETWAAHQATLDQIDRNLAEMAASETQRAARNA